ncbi:hypothetical protein J3459_015790 [Metarhizium acridum]|nr:hypothetical protein J3458_015524 [Metarhizium acridum]KAG8413110.1 hypothetical protein J3459_015790 [Metarhizium acridum]
MSSMALAAGGPSSAATAASKLADSLGSSQDPSSGAANSEDDMKDMDLYLQEIADTFGEIQSMVLKVKHNGAAATKRPDDAKPSP